MKILKEGARIATLLGIEISITHHEEPVTVDNHGLIEHDHTRPWTLEVGFDGGWKSWFVALDRVTLAEVEAYLSALDMVGHRAVVTFFRMPVRKARFVGTTGKPAHEVVAGDSLEYDDTPADLADVISAEREKGIDLWEGYRGPSANDEPYVPHRYDIDTHTIVPDEGREASVNEILEFEKANPETPAGFVNRLTDEVTASLQDPNRGRK